MIDKILLVSCFVAFSCGYLVGVYPRETPASPYPANWDPQRADMSAALKACQEVLALQIKAQQVSH